MDKTIMLNDHRSDTNLSAIEIRRARRLEREAANSALEKHQEKIESEFLKEHEQTREVLLAKVQYLLGLYAETEDGQQSNRKSIIQSVLDDLHLLSDRLDEPSL